jgi:hypothetical protein
MKSLTYISARFVLFLILLGFLTMFKDFLSFKNLVFLSFHSNTGEINRHSNVTRLKRRFSSL